MSASLAILRANLLIKMNVVNSICDCFRMCCRRKKQDSSIKYQEVSKFVATLRKAQELDACSDKTDKFSSEKTKAQLALIDGVEDLLDQVEASSESKLGKLKFRVEHDPIAKTLKVCIREASDLPAMDVGGSSDPYVKISLLPEREGVKSQVFETKAHTKTLAPLFNEEFTFKNISYSDATEKTLSLIVYDFDRFSKHDPIGQIQLPLYQSDFVHPEDNWFPLKPCEIEGSNENKLGELLFSLRYVPLSGKLSLIILEARHLKKMDIGPGGLSDPYVKIYLMYKGKRQKKKKSSIKRRTLNPYYNESFTFDVPSKHIPETTIVLTVVDYDRFSKSDPIGRVTVGSNAGGLELRHWADMLSSPRRPIAQWHELKDPDDKRDS